MKKFLAKFMGSADSATKAKWDALSDAQRNELINSGMQAWGKWVQDHQKSIVDFGGPLGRTKRIGKDGITDIINLDTGYVILEAESHEAAAKLFIGHPHFMMFPGDSVEVMECLPIPGSGK